MRASDKVLNLLDDVGIATTSQIGWFVHPEAMAKGQPQATQAVLSRMFTKGILSREKCLKLGLLDSREFAYSRKDRDIPMRKGGHQLSVNEALLYIQSNKDMDFLEVSAEYKVRHEGSRFVSVNAEALDDGTVLIPDIRIRFRDKLSKQLIWMVECDMGTESIVKVKRGALDILKFGNEDNLRYSLNPSCLIYKPFAYRKFINDGLFEKYEEDGKVAGVQCLFMFQSGLREKRFREAILEYVGKEQPYIWTACYSDIRQPMDFWRKQVWTKAVNEPVEFSITRDDSTIEADYFKL